MELSLSLKGIHAHCIAMAVLEDYAAFKAKAEGLAFEDVKRDLIAKANEKFKKMQESLPPKEDTTEPVLEG